MVESIVKKPKLKLNSLVSALLSKGPLSGMPIFHNSNQGVGEIMTVTPGPDKDSVIVHFEDSENPGKLLTETVNAKDLKQEIAQQRKK